MFTNFLSLRLTLSKKCDVFDENLEKIVQVVKEVNLEY